jgi:TM2 domain-containing membrane protein YozV
VGDFVMAGLCAFICPGLGHLIIGKPFQSLIWFLLIVVGYFMFIVPGIILHLISILDAARAGRKDQISAMTQAIRNANK